MASKRKAPYGEAKNATKGIDGATYYSDDLQTAIDEKFRDANTPKVIKAADMLWENSPHGRIKHLARTEMNSNDKDVDAYMLELPPGGRSGKHRHMAEEFMFVLEGEGYSLHWDVEAVIEERYSWQVEEEPKVFEWEAGDWVYIPVNTIHQDCNRSDEHSARLLCAQSRVYKFLGFGDLEQIESVKPSPVHP